MRKQTAPTTPKALELLDESRQRDVGASGRAHDASLGAAPMFGSRRPRAARAAPA